MKVEHDRLSGTAAVGEPLTLEIIKLWRSKWVFGLTTYAPPEEVEKLKNRLAAKGFREKKGAYSDETFATSP